MLGAGLPADMILLYSSNSDGNCYVITATLDGETTPSNKRSPIVSILPESHSEFLSQIQGSIKCVAPFRLLYGFEGILELQIGDTGSIETFPLNDKQLLLRGCRLTNAEFVYGVVYATGNDTKLMLNRLHGGFKFSSFEKRLNRGVVFAFLWQLILNLITAVGAWYAPTFTSLRRFSFGENIVFEFATSFILLSFIIPLSLYVTMEFMRVGQAKMIELDEECSTMDEMKSPEASGDADFAQVKSSSVIDDLGQIQFVCTDKTGTLTKNEMELRGGFLVDSSLEIFNTKSVNANKNWVQSHNGDLSLKQELDDAKYHKVTLVEFVSRMGELDTPSDPSRDFLLNLLLNNDILINPDSKSQDLENRYQSLSPDEVAFVEALDSNGVALTEITNDSKTICFKCHANQEEKQDDDTKETFRVLGVLHFTANRKRMSVVVEDPRDEGKVKLLTKGADSVVKNLVDEWYPRMDKYLTKYASDGNRTLAFASKVLSDEEFKEWDRLYQDAIVSLKHREKRIQEAFECIESGMNVCIQDL